MMDCFISYSALDADIAKQLQERLAGKGISSFVAEVSVPKGAPWRQEIPMALMRCGALVLLDSPNSRSSATVQQEAGMALASGKLLIPVSLDEDMAQLPGWIDGYQAIKAGPQNSTEDRVDLITKEICDRLRSGWDQQPYPLQESKTVATFVLRAVLLDQYPPDGQLGGAWSRQNDRYMRFYAGDTGPRLHGEAEGASLTFTGMVAERLAAFAASSPGSLAEVAKEALWRAGAFVLSSQDEAQGGFGRRAALRPGASDVHVDLRHTCWAIRALFAIDARGYAREIGRGLRWLAWRAAIRSSGPDADDGWCWTTAPLLVLMSDPRALHVDEWRKASLSLRTTVQSDLEASFDRGLASWLKKQQKEERHTGVPVSVDNALYVLYCLKDCRNVPDKLDEQRALAIERLLSRSKISTGSDFGQGIALDPFGQPEAGPTAQLLEIIADRDRPADYEALVNFVVSSLSSRPMMRLTFSWHLSSALTIPELWDRPIPAF